MNNTKLTQTVKFPNEYVDTTEYDNYITETKKKIIRAFAIPFSLLGKVKTASELKKEVKANYCSKKCSYESHQIRRRKDNYV